MKGREHCGSAGHGGTALRGADHPRFTTGIYTKDMRDLPDQLRADIETWYSDPERQELNLEMAALNARLMQLLRSLKTNDTPAVWTGLRAAVGALKAARAKRDADGARLAVEKIEELVEQGFDDKPVWDEISELASTTGYVKSVQNKREHQRAMALTADRTLALLARVVDVISRHVIDDEIRRAIGVEIGQLVGAPVAMLPAAMGIGAPDDDGDEDAIDAELVEDAA